MRDFGWWLSRNLLVGSIGEKELVMWWLKEVIMVVEGSLRLLIFVFFVLIIFLFVIRIILKIIRIN